MITSAANCWRRCSLRSSPRSSVVTRSWWRRPLAWCRRRHIGVTRGRPYRQNDQAWVEQRNGLVVRRLVGYDRYSTHAAFTGLQRLYRLLRLQLYFFRPVRKLISKERIGSKVCKQHYDRARTPYQRVVAAEVLSPSRGRTLDAQFHALDPIALARDIQRTLDMLWKLADTRRPVTATAAEVTQF